MRMKINPIGVRFEMQRRKPLLFWRLLAQKSVSLKSHKDAKETPLVRVMLLRLG